MRYLKEESLQQQVYRELIADIAAGRLAPGAELPSVRELMRRFSVGRNTAVIVLRRMVREKLARARTGRRAKVADELLARVGLVAFGADTWGNFRYATGAWGFEIGQAVYRALRKQSFLPIFLPSAPDEQRWRGLVAAAVFFFHHAQLAERGMQKPLLRIRVERDWRQNTLLYFDRAPGMAALASYFLVHGVRSLALLGDFSGTNLQIGIQEELLPMLQSQHEIEVRRKSCEITAEEGAGAMSAVLAERPPLPLGVFAAGDFIARGAVQSGLGAGLELKKDFLVVGCTGLAESAAWRPALSVLTTPFAEIGETAAETIRKLLDGEALPEKIVIPSKLIIRGS